MRGFAVSVVEQAALARMEALEHELHSAHVLSLPETERCASHGVFKYRSLQDAWDDDLSRR